MVMIKAIYQFSSITQSVMSNSLRPHELQHARLPCLSSTPGAYSNPGAYSVIITAIRFKILVLGLAKAGERK